jgi:hypothetical protein
MFQDELDNNDDQDLTDNANQDFQEGNAVELYQTTYE